VTLTGANNTCKLAATALVGLAETHADALVANGAVQALLSLLASGNLDIQVCVPLCLSTRLSSSPGPALCQADRALQRRAVSRASLPALLSARAGTNQLVPGPVDCASGVELSIESVR